MTIGLYEALLEENMLMFNPKWNRDCEEINGNDVRDIHNLLKENGYDQVNLEMKQQADQINL